MLGSSAFGMSDKIPTFLAGEGRGSLKDFFTVLSQEYHVFADASAAAYGAVCYSLTNYLNGPPTCRQVYAKGRVTPKGKGVAKTIPRLELAAGLLATEVAKWDCPLRLPNEIAQ